MDHADTVVAEIGLGEKRFPFRFRDNNLCISVNKRILEGQCYPLFPFVSDVACIVDIGANIGAATFYFRMHFPDAAIFAFEPSSEAFALLCENTSPFDGITAVNCALFDADRTLVLHGGLEDSVTSSVAQHGLSGGTSEEIPARDAEMKFREVGIGRIDILKLDTEGCERPILTSIAGRVPGIKVVYVEFHSAEDRLWIDGFLSPTHVLCRAVIDHPHRGEVAYVEKTCLPGHMTADMAIRIGD